MKNELALSYCEKTKGLCQNIERAFLELGQRLMKIRDEKLYLGQYDDFGLYCDDIKISESRVSKLINIYKLFVLQYTIPEEKLIEAGGWSNLAEILPYVKDQESAERLVDMVIQNPRSAVKNLLLEEKTGIEQMKCKHPETYEISICKVCGIKIKLLKDD
jgi:hypothetical protein